LSSIFFLLFVLVLILFGKIYYFMQNTIKAGNVEISNRKKMVLISGPCQIESRDHAVFMAKSIAEICKKLDIGYIFKSSFDKANRSSAKSQRGIGIDAAIDIFKEIKETIGCPILTDVHDVEQCKIMGEVVDILQIPAFLCRQTDLLKAAATTGKIVNVKKGQFLAPWDAKNIVEKLEHFGSKNIMLTERGTSFGYNTLVSDMRGLSIMSDFGYPVIFDATHSVQQPGGLGGASGGDRKFVKLLGRAALAATPIAGIFAEVHENPDCAPSDGPCMLRLDTLEKTLSEFLAIDSLTKQAE
jgi:2-dehydro-3-deoxyphosphooctonate aldolase (KDO 8-P synthase)